MKTSTLRVGLTAAIVTTSLIVSNTAVANQPKLEKSTVTYRTVDGLAILADVYRPAGDKVRPVIVYLHGGALIGGTREINPDYLPTQSLFRLAEEKGCAFVSFDYRLAPETKLPAIITDVEAAFAWLARDGAKQFHIDPTHMVVVGTSAGGYLALLSGYRAMPKPKAIVSLFGYGSLGADWYTKPNPYPAYSRAKITEDDIKPFRGGMPVSDSRLRTSSYDVSSKYYFYIRQKGLWTHEVTGLDGAAMAEGIAPFEPVRHVTRDFPPTLLIHGTMDSDVPIRESIGMAHQFEHHGVPYIFKSIDRAEHGLVGGDPAELDAAFQTMGEFIVRHLEPR